MLECVTSCHGEIHSNTRLATPSEIEELLAVKIEAFTVLESTSISMGLCRDHYMHCTGCYIPNSCVDRAEYFQGEHLTENIQPQK